MIGIGLSATPTADGQHVADRFSHGCSFASAGRPGASDHSAWYRTHGPDGADTGYLR